MDNHVFASLAHISILLVPVGNISQVTFDRYASEIRTFESIRLGDVPADHRNERARFMPSPLATGHLHLSFPTHPPPRSHLPLSLLRPSHFTLAVIGIASCSKANALPFIYAQFHSSLQDIFPSDGLYPLARYCFIFEESEDAGITLSGGENQPGLFVVPHIMGNKRLYLGTLLADLCAVILGELGVIVQALETPLGNEYLNSSPMPMMPPLTEIPSPLNGSRKEFPASQTSASHVESARSSFTLSAAPNTKRNSTVFRQASYGTQPSRKRLSSLGVASSHARLFKILGDLFLLAGRLEDSMVWYNEALQMFKSNQDAAWHAGVLEGLAIVSIVEAWSAGHGLHNSVTASKEPWLEISDKLTQAAALYMRSPLADGDPNYALLTYLYTSCVLRHSSFLFAMWAAKGWGPLAFTAMLHPGPNPYLPPTLSNPDANSGTHLDRLSAVSGTSRSSIANVVAQVHGPWLLHLDPRERISILEAMASLYACLGYRRKEAYVMREVLGCIMDLIVCGREEDGLSRATAGLASAANTAGLAQAWNTVGIRMSESIDGNESVLKLLTHICKILGIDLEAVRLLDMDDTADSASPLEGSLQDSEDGSIHDPHGWPELQVGVVREAVAVAEALPDFPAVAQFALSALKTLQPVLSPADQYHLYSTSNRALNVARRRGDTKSVEYWSGRPTFSIALAPLPLVRLAFEKPILALKSKSSDVAPVLTGSDPFLYNPRKTAGKQGDTIVVQNEILEFVVVLQNPYIFDLELQSLSLSASGVPFDSRPIRILIPANSLHQVVLTGKALEPGTLLMKGCRVQASGGVAHEFILPLSSDDDEERRAKLRSSITSEMGRTKYSGLESFPWEKEKRKARKSLPAVTKFLQFKVIPEQPLLRIRRTSLTHGAVMLYDGEMSTIRITLENISSLPINFLRLAFEDSTVGPAQQALAEGNLSVFDTYETEYNLIHRPAFSWDEQEAQVMPPGEKRTLNIMCNGKVGCTHGTIHVSYSCVSDADDPSASSAVFYTRQISYPVMVTVYHMLECLSLDILLYPRHPLQGDDACGNDTSRRRDDLCTSDSARWCLFSVEVRNTYGLPFDVSFESVIENSASTVTSATVAPGSMSRFVLPVEKFLLSERQTSQSIPTLSDRQFVVEKARLSEYEEGQRRELFWYREELFKRVRGRWKETGGVRAGYLSLRDQRLTQPMLERLRLDNARVAMSMAQRDNGHELRTEGGAFLPPADGFVFLRTRVTNSSPHPLTFTMNLRMEPAEHVIFEGVLSDISVGRLDSGESRELEMALYFLAHGRFEISAEVKTFDNLARAGIGHLVAVVREQDTRTTPSLN